MAGQNQLTVAFVRAVKDPGTYRDGQGLELRVRSATSKQWVLITRYNGKRPEIGLGSALEVTLAQARQKRDRVLLAKAEGIDPRLVLNAAERRTGVPTFDEAAAEVISFKSAEWSGPKQVAQWESSLRTYASPVIGHLPVDRIEIDHIEAILRPVWTVRTETASRVRARIEAVLAWAIVKKFRPANNPAIWHNNLEFLFPAKEKVAGAGHFAALPYADIPELMKDIRHKSSLSARALEFTILTTARSGEVMGAQWSEFTGNIWTVPAHRMKARREHRVPLTPRVLEILDGLPRVNDFVFPGIKGHISNNTVRKFLQDQLGIKNATPHGFRSTFKDWAAECTDFPGDISEAQLAHKIKNATQAAYERGDKLEKRRQLLMAWEAYCGY